MSLGHALAEALRGFAFPSGCCCFLSLLTLLDCI